MFYFYLIILSGPASAPSSLSSPASPISVRIATGVVPGAEEAAAIAALVVDIAGAPAANIVQAGVAAAVPTLDVIVGFYDPEVHDHSIFLLSASISNFS